MVVGQYSESSYRVAVDLQQRQGHTRSAVGTGRNHDAGKVRKALPKLWLLLLLPVKLT